MLTFLAIAVSVVLASPVAGGSSLPKCPKGTALEVTQDKFERTATCVKSNGVEHGPYRRYARKKGTLIEAGTYANGKLHGLKSSYRGNGSKMMQSIYVMGEKTGPMTMFYGNGKSFIWQVMKTGVGHGARKSWHINGQLRSQGRWEKGEACGEFECWHADGKQQRGCYSKPDHCKATPTGFTCSPACAGD